MTAQNVLPVQITDVPALLQAYMPALEHGGIFVPCEAYYALGQQVSLLLTLPGESEPLTVTGQVAWISPPGVTGQRRAGIGVHLSAADVAVREHIEAQLEGLLDKGTATHTLLSTPC